MSEIAGYIVSCITMIVIVGTFVGGIIAGIFYIKKKDDKDSV